MPTSINLYYLPLNKNGYDKNLSVFTECLDAEELTRWQKFKVEHARDSFLQARKMIKTILAEKLGMPVPAVRFKYNANGKPYLENSPWHFSISHCRAAVAIACANCELGVDVEMVNRGENLWREAENYINPWVKQQIVESHRDPAREFTRYWTAMESVVKLKGSTLFAERDGFKLDTSKQGQFCHDIQVRDWSLDQSWHLSLAYHKGDCHVEQFEWNQGKVSPTSV